MIEARKHVEELINQFDIQIEIADIVPFGSGHINDTYRVVSHDSAGKDYLLQRINHKVFPNVLGMMNNIHLVLDHLNKFGSALDPLELIPSINSELFIQEESGNYWRLFDFKKGTLTCDIVQSPEQAYQGGKAFGAFLNNISGLNPNALVATIPDFHNVIKRLDQLSDAIKLANPERHKRSEGLIEDVQGLANHMVQIEKLKSLNKFPIRVTHNDTKFNNVLLDEYGVGVCVIDLDTVMPGIVHYDFGDGIRTSTNTAAEDENDLSLVEFDLEKFKGFAKGYLEGCNGILTPFEINYLAQSGAVISYIIAIRFLADFLLGDRYYKTSYQDQNYFRARCQLHLAHQIMNYKKELNQIVQSEAGLII